VLKSPLILIFEARNIMKVVRKKTDLKNQFLHLNQFYPNPKKESLFD